MPLFGRRRDSPQRRGSTGSLAGASPEEIRSKLATISFSANTPPMPVSPPNTSERNGAGRLEVRRSSLPTSSGLHVQSSQSSASGTTPPPAHTASSATPPPGSPLVQHAAIGGHAGRSRVRRGSLETGAGVPFDHHPSFVPQHGSPQNGSPQHGSPQHGSPLPGSPIRGSPLPGSPIRPPLGSSVGLMRANSSPIITTPTNQAPTSRGRSLSLFERTMAGSRQRSASLTREEASAPTSPLYSHSASPIVPRHRSLSASPTQKRRATAIFLQVESADFRTKSLVLHVPGPSIPLGVALAGAAPVCVKSITPSSPAERAGLTVFDRILAVNGTGVASASLNTVTDLLRVAVFQALGDRISPPSTPPPLAAHASPRRAASRRHISMSLDDLSQMPSPRSILLGPGSTGRRTPVKKRVTFVKGLEAPPQSHLRSPSVDNLFFQSPQASSTASPALHRRFSPQPFADNLPVLSLSSSPPDDPLPMPGHESPLMPLLDAQDAERALMLLTPDEEALFDRVTAPDSSLDDASPMPSSPLGRGLRDVWRPDLISSPPLTPAPTPECSNATLAPPHSATPTEASQEVFGGFSDLSDTGSSDDSDVESDDSNVESDGHPDPVTGHLGLRRPIVSPSLLLEHPPADEPPEPPGDVDTLEADDAFSSTAFQESAATSAPEEGARRLFGFQGYEVDEAALASFAALGDESTVDDISGFDEASPDILPTRTKAVPGTAAAAGRHVLTLERRSSDVDVDVDDDLATYGWE